MLTRGFKLTVSGDIESLVPYPPGKPIEELERELGITGSIKLASNENPLGPSPAALSAVKGALAGVNRYPDGSCYYLRRALSRALGVGPDNLIFGNGSNEIIELLIRTFLRPGDEALMPEPSFAVYPLAAKAAGVTAVRAPLKDFRVDLDAMAALVRPRTRLVFIANPNNPTGTAVSAVEMKAFVDSMPEDVIVCVDEAYREFARGADFPRTIGYVLEGRPVVVLRTFSKIYGLAGLRIGYGIARPEMVSYLDRVRQPFNVNSLAQVAALAALGDDAHIERTRRNNSEGLDYLFGALRAMGLECVPTEANFFLVRVGDGAGVYDALLKKGVIVRPMAGYGLPEHIRVTVGLPEENRRFIESLNPLLG
jgi:histidinol-phosphate aminotransferase